MRRGSAKVGHGNSSLQHLLHDAQQGVVQGGVGRGDAVPAKRGVSEALRARVAAAKAAQAEAAATEPTPSLHTLNRKIDAVQWMRGRTFVTDVCICSIVRLRDGDGRAALVSPLDESNSRTGTDWDLERNAVAPLRRSAEENRREWNSPAGGVNINASLGNGPPLEPNLGAAKEPGSTRKPHVPIGGTPTDRVRRRKFCELALRTATQRGVAVAVDADDLGTDCTGYLRVRLPVRVRINEWSDLAEFDPWLELLRRQPGAAAAALTSCRADLQRAGVDQSLAASPSAVRVESSGFACAIVPHPTVRAGFRVWMGHVTDCSASSDLEIAI